MDSSENIEEQIQAHYQMWQQQPDNPAHPLAIAQAYARRQEFANAILWLHEAIAQFGRLGNTEAVRGVRVILSGYEDQAGQISPESKSITKPASSAGDANTIHQKLEALNELLRASATPRS